MRGWVVAVDLALCLVLGTGCDAGSGPTSGNSAAPIGTGKNAQTAAGAGALLGGAGINGGTIDVLASAGAGAPSCVPDAATFDETVRPLLEQRCGRCHGETPRYGAPFTLLHYDKLVEGAPGDRIVDRIVTQLGAGTMPPAGNLRPTPDEHEQITRWASCGQNVPPYPTALVANRSVLKAGNEIPANTRLLKVTAQQFAVPEGTQDLYQNFQFDHLVDEDQLVRRIDVIIDKSRVVHHITLRYGNPGFELAYVYAWAPGTGAIEFPNGGLRIKPSDDFQLQIHYNNVSGDGDVADSSGVAFYVGATEGTEYTMLDPHTWGIVIPPHATGQAVAHCQAQSDFRIFAGMPHMHQLGESYRHELQHADGTSESVIQLDHWAFDLQFFYDLGVDVKAGESMTITCNYRNDRDTQVTGGQGTQDEMCFDFMYVTPANAGLLCL